MKDDLISRQAVIDLIMENDPFWCEGMTRTIFDGIDRLPSVDAVPVIRCRDCKFLRFTGTVWKCQNRLVMMLCEPNDYCSRAERKEECSR